MCIHLTLLTLSCSLERRSSEKKIWAGAVEHLDWRCDVHLAMATLCASDWWIFSRRLEWNAQVEMRVWWDAVTCISGATRSCALHSRTCFEAGFAQVEERGFANNTQRCASSRKVLFSV